MICILLSTYNGEKYLEEQLQSLVEQENVEIEILVRDDGSEDATREILDKWQEKGLLKWYTGENLGPPYSFMDLLYQAPNADFYAFCDQDDVWLPDKLETAVNKLEHLPDVDVTSALYFSTRTLVDAQLNKIGKSRHVKFKLSFGESLLRNPAVGCTLVFNRVLKEKITGKHPGYVCYHDWWTYCVCVAIDGHCIFDEKPSILYRQHGNNMVGEKLSFYAILKRRFLSFMKGYDKRRLLTFENLLNCYKDELAIDKVEILTNLLNYRRSISAKVKLILTPEIQTGTFGGRLAFIIAVLCNRY